MTHVDADTGLSIRPADHISIDKQDEIIEPGPAEPARYVRDRRDALRTCLRMLEQRPGGRVSDSDPVWRIRERIRSLKAELQRPDEPARRSLRPAVLSPRAEGVRLMADRPRIERRPNEG